MGNITSKDKLRHTPRQNVTQAHPAASSRRVTTPPAVDRQQRRRRHHRECDGLRVAGSTAGPWPSVVRLNRTQSSGALGLLQSRDAFALVFFQVYEGARLLGVISTSLSSSMNPTPYSSADRWAA
jgi:hypothetical protein